MKPEQALVPRKADWLTVGQFTFSVLAAAVLLVSSLISTLILFLQGSLNALVPPGFQDLSPFLFTAGVGFLGLLVIPSAVFSGRKLFTSKPPYFLSLHKYTWLTYTFPLLILIGYAIQTGPSSSRGFLLIFHLLANGLAVLWLLSLARRNLPRESAQRISGSLASGMALSPLITFVLEIVLLVMLGMIGLIVIQSSPGLKQELLDLVTRLQNSPVDPAVLEGMIGRFAARPGVIGALFFYMSVLVPLVEELLKPLAVWLLLGRKLRPWEGFSIGAASGAGFALFENLTIGAAADIWTLVIVSRLGTAAIHIFTAGLVGWGLVEALTNRRYGRLAGSFLAAFILHGVWNSFNILSAVVSFDPVRDLLGEMGTNLGIYAPVGLVLLALGSVLGILIANAGFRRAIIAQEN